MDVTLARILPTGPMPELRLAQPQSAIPALVPPERSGMLAGQPGATAVPAPAAATAPGAVPLSPSSPPLAIPGITGVTNAAGARAARNPLESFGTVLAQAIQNINQLQQTADSDAARFSAGESVDLHQVMIEMEQANLSFSLGLQVRNKLLEAYQEVMRMNV